MIQHVLNLTFTAWMIGSTYSALRAKPRDSGDGRNGSKRKGSRAGKDDAGDAPKPKRVHVDAVFYARLRAILRIVIPGIRSKEAILLIMHSSLLIFRTAISIYVANLDGKSVFLFALSSQSADHFVKNRRLTRSRSTGPLLA